MEYFVYYAPIEIIIEMSQQISTIATIQLQSGVFSALPECYPGYPFERYNAP